MVLRDDELANKCIYMYMYMYVNIIVRLVLVNGYCGCRSFMSSQVPSLQVPTLMVTLSCA